MNVSKTLGCISKLLVILSTGVILSGCAVKGTGPLFSYVQPLNDKAIIVHYRVPRGAGSAAQYDVLSNEAPLTTIGNGGFFEQIADPGPIVYKAKFQQHSGAFMAIGHAIDNAHANYKEAYRLNVEAGKVYYLRWGLGVVPKIEQVPKDEALPQLEGLRSFQPSEVSEG